MGQIWTQVVLNPLIQSLTWLQGISDSYGLALILLAIFFKLLLLPLVRWQTHWGRAVQRLQPQLQSLQRQYAGDQARLNQETMALYQRAGINPATGCLWSLVLMAINLTIWIGLYQTVRNLSGLQEGFLWLPDLALPNGWPIPSPQFAYLVLPVLLGAVQFLSHRIAFASGAAQSLPLGQAGANLRPWIFGVAAALLPSGLVLFWLTSSLFDLVYQSFAVRRISLDKAATAIIVLIMLAPVIGGGVWAFLTLHSIWLSLYLAAALLALVFLYLISLASQPYKIQQALYYFLPHLSVYAALFLAYRRWGGSWLTPLVATLGVWLFVTAYAYIMRRIAPRLTLKARIAYASHLGQTDWVKQSRQQLQALGPEEKAPTAISGRVLGILGGLLVAAGTYRMFSSPYLGLIAGWYTYELIYPRLTGFAGQPNKREQFLHFLLPRLLIGPLVFFLALQPLQALPRAAAAAYLAVVIFEFLFSRLVLRLFPVFALKAQSVSKAAQGRFDEAAALADRLWNLGLAKLRQYLQEAEQLQASNPAAAQLRYQRVIQVLAGRAKRTDEENGYLAQAYLGQGQLHETAQNEAEAIDSYSKARKLGLAEATMRLAPLLARQGKWNENAVEVYLAYLQARQGAAQTEDDQTVLSTLERACRIKAGDRGQKLSRAMRRNEAVLQAVPDVEWAHYYLGVGSLQKGQPRQARSHLERARQLDPARAAAHYYLGQAYLQTGQPEAARDAFEESLRLDPKQPEAAFQLGQILLEPLLTGAVSLDNARGQERLNLALRWLKEAVSQDKKKDTYFYYLGRTHLLRQAYPEAAEALQRATALNKRQKEYFYYQAVAYKELKQIAKAKESLNKALSLDKDYAIAHHLLADLYFGERAFEEAALHYWEVLRLDNDNAPVRRCLGQSLYEMGDYRQAATELEPVAAQSQPALFYLARSQAKLGQFEAAIASLQQLVTTFGPDAEAYYYLGCAQANAGLAGSPYGYEQALIAFEQCLEVDPGYWPAHLQKGQVHLKLKRLAEARQAYLQAQAFQPQNPTVLYALGQVAYLSGDVAQAQTVFEQALKHAPDHAPARLGLGVVYEEQGDVARALQAYQQAGAHDLLGALYCKQGEYAGARDHLLKAQAEGNESDALLNYLGFALAQDHQYQEAWQAWSQLQARHPDDPRLELNMTRVHYQLGCEHARAGRYAEAAQAWEKYLETYPDDDQVREDLAEVFFRLGEVALRAKSGGNEKTKWAFQRALDLAGDNSAYEYYLALSELENQEYQASSDRLRRLAEAEPDRLEYSYHLGLALVHQSQLEEAREQLQRVVSEAAESELGLKARGLLAGLYMREERWQTAADLLGELV